MWQPLPTHETRSCGSNTCAFFKRPLLGLRRNCGAAVLTVEKLAHPLPPIGHRCVLGKKMPIVYPSMDSSQTPEAESYDELLLLAILLLSID